MGLKKLTKRIKKQVKLATASTKRKVKEAKKKSK